MWETVIKALGNVGDRINKGFSAGIEVAKSQNGGSANSGSSNNITDTTVFGKALGTTVNKIKDYAKNSKEENGDGTEEDEGTI